LGDAAAVVVIIRIYFNSLHAEGGLWAKISKPCTALRLAEEALHQGIPYALATIGSAGFVRGARHVEPYATETASERLPSCLELVGAPEQIECFLNSQRGVLQDAVVIKMTGAEVLEGRSLP
jgi:PII-like signaling protein